MKFLCQSEIVDDVVSKMTVEDKLELSKLAARDMIKFHHGVGTFIRNEYKLWDRNNPLTAIWFIDNESGNEKYIKNGVDCHPNHPDAVSMDILLEIWEVVTGNKEHLTPEQLREEVLNGIKFEINQGKRYKI